MPTLHQLKLMVRKGKIAQIADERVYDSAHTHTLNGPN